MTRQQMGKVWSVVSLFLLYYAVNSFLATQGGNPVFGASLIMTARVSAAFVAIPVCSFLLIMGSLIGIDFARRSGRSWADRIPVVGFDQIDTSRKEARLYQAIMLVMLSVIPALTLIHFWTTIWTAPLTSTTRNPVVLQGGIWNWSLLTTFNNPAYICTELDPTSPLLCKGGATILPGFEPTIFAVLTLAGICTAVVFWVLVIRGSISRQVTKRSKDSLAA